MYRFLYLLMFDCTKMVTPIELKLNCICTIEYLHFVSRDCNQVAKVSLLYFCLIYFRRKELLILSLIIETYFS